ncbi:OmpA family protein [Telmatospirillum sp. J64-1]|uniref:OmpA family protein n=1 Tax=Telmatospirillum sp. J64-1 TaxID=2502183 RepID=UPI00115C9AA4|nr:OmpA family protein [Telmatospirillum sp. J64-1]
MIRPAAIALLVGSLAACAGVTANENPERLSALRAQIQQAQADPAVNRHAPVELREAAQALAQAQSATDEEAFRHWAFMAESRLALAQSRTSAEQARQQTQTLAQQMEIEGEVQQRLQMEGARQTQDGTTVVSLGDVLFEVGRAELQPGAFNRLQPLVNHLRNNPNQYAVIEGHTDSTGSSELNQRLSQERAEAVRQYLITAGIQPDRIVARGLGQDFPIASNETSAGRQQNRRVEVQISEAPE